MTQATLAVTRRQILAFRRRSNSLVARLPMGKRSLRRVAWAGLQDSMPRAALLSINARVEDATATTWEEPAYVQIWGPRFSVYVVAVPDFAVFTLGRFPDEPAARAKAQELASRLAAFLEGGSVPFGKAGHALGVNPNQLRYATTTGTIVLRWDGARQPTVRVVVAPQVDPAHARRELARRYLHVFGPATAESFAGWAGIRTPAAVAAFDQLQGSLTPVKTPIGPAWILNSDESAIRVESETEGDNAVRLLPSGDSYFLLQGDDRALLVPDADRRAMLWTPRVWPGAILAGGEIVGTWRRAKNKLTIQAWERCGRELRDQIDEEAAALPLPESTGDIEVIWTD